MSSESIAFSGDTERKAARGPLLWLWALIACLLLFGSLHTLQRGWELYWLLDSVQHEVSASAQQETILSDLTWAVVPPVGWLLAACLLIWFRRDLGLKVAIAAIWLAPAMQILHLAVANGQLLFALRQRPLHQWAYPLLASGWFGAAGCSAFLLAAPQIRLLFPSGKRGSIGGTEEEGERDTFPQYRRHGGWLAVLIAGCLLSLPIVVGLAVEIAIGYKLSSGQVSYRFRPFQAETIVGGLLTTAAILLLVWRRHSSILISLVLVWIFAVMPWLFISLEMIFGPVYPALTATGKLYSTLYFWIAAYRTAPGAYGIDILMAIGWSAYLLSSPDIRRRYPRRRDLRLERERLDVF